uniref:MFS domain-containing protein n=1 Tax=Angiostrongylus cantonensis TaxID=6313 RepID=A0A0K0D3B6_ANGCA
MRRAPSLRMILVAFAVSLGGPFHFGYQLLITNPAQSAFIRFFNETFDSELHITVSGSTLDKIWSFIVAVLFLGALAGSFSIRPVADKIGRKRGLYLSLGIGVLSATASACSKVIPSVLLYSCSRITVGYSAGLSLGLSALFLSESSLKECRGSIGMIIGMCVQLGILMGSILAMPQIFGTVRLWYMIYVAEILMMLTFLIFLPFLPETPGYLVQKGTLEAAKKSLMFYFNCNDEAAEVHLIHIKEEQKLLENSHTMVDVMKDASLRRKTFVGIVVMLAMSFSGSTVINAYAVELLRSTGLTTFQASLANVGIVAVGMVGCYFLLILQKHKIQLLLLSKLENILSNY